MSGRQRPNQFVFYADSGAQDLLKSMESGKRSEFVNRAIELYGQQQKREKVSKGHCPECGPDRYAYIRGEHVAEWEDEGSGVHGTTKIRILECRGCESFYIQRTVWCSEDWPDDGPSINYWPTPFRRKKPDWLSQLFQIHGDLFSLMDDTYVALNNDVRVLAAIGIRTVFDLSSELLGVDRSLSFASKLKVLEQTGKIGAEEKHVLDTLIEAGSAAQRGWKPSLDQLETMLNTVENFLYRSFILNAAVKKLKANVPSNPANP